MINKTHPIALKLIQSALEHTQQLEQLLTEEAALLKGKSPALALDTITGQKNTLVSQLTTFANQVEQILATEKLSKEAGMPQYFVIAELAGIDTSTSSANWHKLTDASKNCRLLNEQNGACIHILNQHSQRILNILKGKSQTINTYSRDGRAKSNPYSRTLVSV